MTGFTRNEFERLWDVVGSSIITGYLNDRGPKPKNTCNDMFFMMINVLHTPTKWEKHGIDFTMKGPTIEKQVWKMMQIAAPILCKYF